jgi:predicted O-methyltransferase YrrM
MTRGQALSDGPPAGWRARPLAGALRLRKPVSEHSSAEGELLQRHAAGARRIVEIGVAEGASAAQLREVMDPDGSLHLIDPYPPGRLFGINMSRVIAERLVARVDRGRVEWIRKLSHDAYTGWSGEIDFLFIDGDHSYAGAMRDWEQWSACVVPGGKVALHDARVADTSWVRDDDGPARVLREAIEPSQEWVVLDGADSMVITQRVAP